MDLSYLMKTVDALDKLPQGQTQSRFVKPASQGVKRVVIERLHLPQSERKFRDVKCLGLSFGIRVEHSHWARCGERIAQGSAGFVVCFGPNVLDEGAAPDEFHGEEPMRSSRHQFVE